MPNYKRRPALRGFTYLGLMFVIVVLALTATMASQVWAMVQQRANEAELAFVGEQFSQAIERYRQRPLEGGLARYPMKLEELLRDARSLQIERHLRRVYFDPMTGSLAWGLVTLKDGSVVGVHSVSDKAPIRGTLLADRLGFSTATSYRDWRFIAPSAAPLLEAGNGAETATRNPPPGPQAQQPSAPSTTPGQ